jgi:hypothetical protein
MHSIYIGAIQPTKNTKFTKGKNKDQADNIFSVFSRIWWAGPLSSNQHL